VRTDLTLTRGADFDLEICEPLEGFINGASSRKSEAKMNQRDWELLDKELWGARPHNGGILGFALVTVFLVGLSIGGVLFAPESHQMTSHNATVLSFLNGSPSH